MKLLSFYFQVLTDKNNELQEKYKDTETIPKPDYW